MNNKLKEFISTLLIVIGEYVNRRKPHRITFIIDFGLCIVALIFGSMKVGFPLALALLILFLCLLGLLFQILDFYPSTIIDTVRRIRISKTCNAAGTTSIKRENSTIDNSTNTDVKGCMVHNNNSNEITSSMEKEAGKSTKDKPSNTIDRNKLKLIFSEKLSNNAFECLADSLHVQSGKIKAGDYGKLIYRFIEESEKNKDIIHIFSDEMFCKRKGVTTINFCKLITNYYEAIGIACPKDTREYYGQGKSEIIDNIYLEVMNINGT